MNEEKRLKRNLIKNTCINLCIFILLFLIFDIIIYNQISISLYKSVDNELTKEMNTYSGEKYLEEKDKKKEISPRNIWIKRDENNNIINSESLGRVYEKFGENIPFDKSSINEIYSIELDGGYSYRGINFTIINENGENIYVQLLTNVDGERQTLSNLFSTLVIGTAILITISLLISYILSKRMMKPLFNAYKKQTEFVENASHELRTPLTIIQAKQELLLQEPESKIIDKSEDINLTINETRRLGKLVKELMLLATADANKLKLQKEPVDIDKFLKEITDPYVEYARLQEKTLSLDLNCNKTINISPNKISQLIIILLDNAIKYTAEGEEIKVSSFHKDGKCVIEISDTGIGIGDEQKKHIFERFYRADKARSRETGGTGLGLSIAQTIVKLHGGSIKVSDNTPKGTKFTIRI